MILNFLIAYTALLLSWVGLMLWLYSIIHDYSEKRIEWACIDILFPPIGIARALIITLELEL